MGIPDPTRVEVHLGWVPEIFPPVWELRPPERHLVALGGRHEAGMAGGTVNGAVQKHSFWQTILL